MKRQKALLALISNSQHQKRIFTCELYHLPLIQDFDKTFLSNRKPSQSKENWGYVEKLGKIKNSKGKPQTYRGLPTKL